MVIYKITNNINGKAYIGQTRYALSKRIANHHKNKSYIGAALRKYGIEAFTMIFGQFIKMAGKKERTSGGGMKQFIENEICDALGLKHVSKLDIHFEVGKIATCEAVFMPEIDGVEQFPAILKKFELVEKKENKEAA